MARDVTASAARRNLAALLDEVATQRTTVIITRRRGPAVALIAATELAGLEETEYLLRSPANRRHLFAALDRALTGETPPMTPAALRTEIMGAPPDPSNV